MGANMNFKGLGNDVNFSLARQPSVYSLTFDEFQTTLGKDFGSMNMEELLKSIWSAEETQNSASAPADTSVGNGSGGYLQRQGSVTLPRTLSMKTVDEVWKDIAKDYGTGKDTGVAAASLTQDQRQPTLGEITLEEFLVRAGVVREDKPNPGGYLGNLAQVNSNGNNMGFGIPPVLPLNVNGVRSTQPQATAPIFPKQSAVSCAPSMTIPSSTRHLDLASPGIRGGMGIVGRGIGTKSPSSLSSDGLTSSDDVPSVSPVPYMFNGDLRGRKSNNTVEKVIERRHRRMIKNRESAARSRARKQAYTMELEQEVAKLKEENAELRKKQAEIVEKQKNQVLEMMNNAQHGAKKRRLTRSLTGPW